VGELNFSPKARVLLPSHELMFDPETLRGGTTILYQKTLFKKRTLQLFARVRFEAVLWFLIKLPFADFR